jgi:chorismate dehydratase
VTPCRIACVRYLNTAPLVEGLEHAEGVSLIPAVPSRIVDLLCSGQADVGLASVVDAACSPVPLSVLDAGMIGCDGATMTVRVFSSVPFDRVGTLHADSDSHTSVVLARLLLEVRFGRRVRVVTFDARERVSEGEPADPRPLDEAWPETVLLIGDKVAADPPPGERYPHQLDLGEAWKEWTGLPFVYAAWMCRTSDAGSAQVRTARALLDRQRRHNATRLGWIIARRAPRARWPGDLAGRYLGSLLRFDLDERAREGLARFLHEAGRLALLPEREGAFA